MTLWTLISLWWTLSLSRRYNPRRKIMLSLKRVDGFIEIHTDFGIVGPRLERGSPMPRFRDRYPDTPEGEAEAMFDMAKIVEYIDRHNDKKHSRLYRKRRP